MISGWAVSAPVRATSSIYPFQRRTLTHNLPWTSFSSCGECPPDACEYWKRVHHLYQVMDPLHRLRPPPPFPDSAPPVARLAGAPGVRVHHVPGALPLVPVRFGTARLDEQFQLFEAGEALAGHRAGGGGGGGGG